MASPTPVLPDVGSTIVPPGFNFPSRSAASIIGSPMRSFTDPPGFRYSSFARIWAPPRGLSLSRRTIGVAPTSSRIDGYSCDTGRKRRGGRHEGRSHPGRDGPALLPNVAGTLTRGDGDLLFDLVERAAAHEEERGEHAGRAKRRDHPEREREAAHLGGDGIVPARDQVLHVRERDR